MTQLLNELMKDKADCRIAPDTPDLLIIILLFSNTNAPILKI